MTRLVPAVTGATTALVVAVASAAGTVALTAALVLASLVVASGWATLLGLPSPRGSTAVIAVAGVAAALAVALTSGPPYLRWLPTVLALAVILEFGHQLFRRDMRPRLAESLTGVVAGVVVVALGAGWLGALRLREGPDLVLVAAAAALGASAATGLPWPQRVTGPTALVGGVAMAALVGTLLAHLPLLPTLLLGAGVGAVVAALDRVLAILPAVRQLPAGAAMGAASVAACGLVVYALARLVA